MEPNLKSQMDNSMMVLVPADESGAIALVMTFLINHLYNEVAAGRLPCYIDARGVPRSPDVTDLTVRQTDEGLTIYYRWYNSEGIPSISEYSIGYSSAGFSIQ